MLRNTHRPQYADAIGLRDHARDFGQRFNGQSCPLAGHLHRERLKALEVFRGAIHPLIDECLVRKPVLQNVARHCREPNQICAGARMQEDIGTPRHFVLAQIGHDELLAAQLMRALDARSKHRMAFGCIAPDDHHKPRLLDIGDGAGVAAIPNRAKQPRCRGRLAVARAVIHVIGADNCASQLLHQIAFFIGTL